MKEIYDYLGTPEKVRFAISRLRGEARLEAEERIIDMYLEKLVKSIGYIPKDCTDINILYEACLGCGLCKGTNPVQWGK